MFPEGSATPYERTRALLEALAPSMRTLPNRIEITGHTSGSRGSALPNSGAWELSTNRALSVRAILGDAGVPEDRFAGVVGKADTEPMFPDDPLIASNRRVTILMLNEMPPIPANVRP